MSEGAKVIEWLRSWLRDGHNIYLLPDDAAQILAAWDERERVLREVGKCESMHCIDGYECWREWIYERSSTCRHCNGTGLRPEVAKALDVPVDHNDEDGWVVDGSVTLCPKCRRALEGTAAWALQHERSCGWRPRKVQA